MNGQNGKNGDGLTFRQSIVIPYLLGAVFLGIGLLMILKTDAPWWFGTVFAAAGVLVIVFTTSTTSVIDRMAGKITVTTSGLFRKSVREIGFGEVSEVAVTERYSRSSKGNSQRYYSIVVRCKDKSECTLTSRQASSVYVMGLPVGDSRAKTVEQAKQVAQIIGVPLREERMPSAGEVLNVVASTIREKMDEAEKRKR